MSNVFDMRDCDYASITDHTDFEPLRLAADAADQHFAILDGEDQVRARCSIWWRDTPHYEGRRAGAIGHYAATSSRYAQALLDHACRQLRGRGCELVIGPLDGSTWRRYRFITERGIASRFYLEPDNPEDWPRQFRNNGFAELAQYESEINPDIRNRQPQLGNLRRKLQKLGVRIETLNKFDAVAELRGIHSVACESFRGSFLYTPLDFASFNDLYATALTGLDPRLMLVARHGERIVGFIFAPPDLLQSPPIDTIVLKTVAILPAGEYRGLGRVLIVDLLQNAVQMGFGKAISALMQCSGRSQQISSDCAGPMRRYAVFARDLRS